MRIRAPGTSAYGPPAPDHPQPPAGHRYDVALRIDSNRFILGRIDSNRNQFDSIPRRIANRIEMNQNASTPLPLPMCRHTPLLSLVCEAV